MGEIFISKLEEIEEHPSFYEVLRLKEGEKVVKEKEII